MVESNFTNNEIGVENSKVKKPFSKIIFPLVFIVILGVAFYFLKDLIILKFFKKDVTTPLTSTSSSTETSEEKNPFKSLISNPVSEDDFNDSSVSIGQYLKIYEEYRMGNQGIPGKFESFNKDAMTMKINLLAAGDVEKSHKEYSLVGDFVILCEKIDPCCTYIDYSGLNDFQKSNIAMSVKSMSLDKKISLLENYEKDKGVGLIFENHNSVDINNDSLKVKKILLKIDNPESCYEE